MNLQPTGDLWCEAHGFIPCKCVRPITNTASATFVIPGAADLDVVWCATIYGACASKANSRRLVFNRKTKRAMFIKSKPAEQFRKEMLWQIANPISRGPHDVPLFDCDLSITCRVYYASQRNDLDCSLIYDCLQEGGIVKNDRQFKEQHCYRFTDKERPRVEIEMRRV